MTQQGEHKGPGQIQSTTVLHQDPSLYGLGGTLLII